ncbi:MAG: hypothetical protein INQ03_14630 [Candidatus Heimdallarchaeota archaeon]|nr:hypothetical protein [Candidatus Heimdallarchaeota archaeon]
MQLNESSLYDMITSFISLMDLSVQQFNDLLVRQKLDFGKSNLQLARELLTLDSISNSNLKRLDSLTSRLSSEGRIIIANQSDKRELQVLLIKSSTSCQLRSDILGSPHHPVINRVDEARGYSYEINFEAA